MSIIPTDVNYNYSLMKQNLKTLKNTHSFLNVQSVGESVLGKNLYVVKLRNWFKRSFFILVLFMQMSGLQAFYL